MSRDEILPAGRIYKAAVIKISIRPAVKCGSGRRIRMNQTVADLVERMRERIG